MSQVAELVRRLSEIQDLLTGLPNDAFAERSSLIVERDRLQELASEYSAGADQGRPTEDLLNELEELSGQGPAIETSSRSVALHTVSRINRLTGILSARGINYLMF